MESKGIHFMPEGNKWKVIDELVEDHVRGKYPTISMIILPPHVVEYDLENTY